MKSKLIDLVEAHASFTEIKNTNKIHFALAWKISDIIDVLEKHTARYHNERNELLKKYGKEDVKNPGHFNFDKKTGEELNKKIDILANTILDIKGFDKLNKEMLFDSSILLSEKINITALKFFIK